MLWKFNRFLPEKPCQTGTLAKRLLLMLIDVGLPAICVILPPAPSVLQEDSSDACVYIRGSVRRASGFVLTDKPETMSLPSTLENLQRELCRVKVEVQQPVIDSKGVNNRRNRQNRNTRRNLLPNCYQKHGKWVRGRIVGDRPLHFHGIHKENRASEDASAA